jgi:hypothetical protein
VKQLDDVAELDAGRRAMGDSVRDRGPGAPSRHGGAIVGGSSASVGKRWSIQSVSPPCRGRTRVMPFRFSKSATLALVASLGQEQ